MFVGAADRRHGRPGKPADADLSRPKFQEVQKYLSMTGHVYTPAYRDRRQRSWERCPADVRKILEDTAKAVEAGRARARREARATSWLSKMKTAGDRRSNEADKAAFVKASKAIYEEFSKEVKGGQALIDKSLALAKSS